MHFASLATSKTSPCRGLKKNYIIMCYIIICYFVGDAYMRS